MSLTLLLLILFETSMACEFKWEPLLVKTPLYDQMARPQGLTYLKNSLVISVHFKDSINLNKSTSKIYFYKLPELKLENTLSFPERFHHISGLANKERTLYFVDFDNRGVFKADVLSSFKNGRVEPQRVFNIETMGLSGLSIHGDLLAVSHYIHPLKKPYLADRYIQFYNLSTGKKINFIGDIKESNYSQGLTFFKKNGVLYLAETINDFQNVLKYKITGIDEKPDILRLYSIHLDSKRIKLVSESPLPATMAEDLAFDGEYLYTTDEQTFNFHRASIHNCPGTTPLIF